MRFLNFASSLALFFSALFEHFGGLKISLKIVNKFFPRWVLVLLLKDCGNSFVVFIVLGNYGASEPFHGSLCWHGQGFEIVLFLLSYFAKWNGCFSWVNAACFHMLFSLRTIFDGLIVLPRRGQFFTNLTFL